VEEVTDDRRTDEKEEGDCRSAISRTADTPNESEYCGDEIVGLIDDEKML
jgi:hypothetical protein